MSRSFSLRAALRAARRLATAVTMAVAVACLVAAPIVAHGELVLELGAERIQPGGTIEVRGDLESGESFEVALISKVSGSRRVIATIPAVEEGHFQSFVTIPADVTGGDYLVEVAVDLIVVRAPLTVAGAAIAPEGGGQPEQEEGLIQPFPSAADAANVAGGPRSIDPTVLQVPQPTSIPIERSPLEWVVIVAAATAIAAAAVAGLRLTARRRRRLSS